MRRIALPSMAGAEDEHGLHLNVAGDLDYFDVLFLCVW